MSPRFVSEPLQPLEASFDPARMATGEPGLPRGFRWRDRELLVAEVLESGRRHGNCRNGSGERYLRRHDYRLRTTDGLVIRVYFQRSAHGRIARGAPRWWLQSVEGL